ncbi:MAG TPA: DUF4230 domain-containing protein [Gemmatimonadales bacterium]|nr:DUF4230 domain-containing protein [Gemmatimonadales bacterium]
MADPRHRRSSTAVLLSLALLAGALLLIALAVQRFSPVARRLLPGGQTEVSHSIVVEQVRSVAQLVTSETTVRDVVVYQNRHLGSTKRSLVVVTGKVMAGIDLDAGTSVDVNNQDQRIRVLLPPATVLSVEVTQLRTYDERNGLWNPFRPADRDTIYQLAREQLVSAAGELGVTRHAQESAQRLLPALIHADGYTVEVRFGPSPSSPAEAAEQ